MGPFRIPPKTDGKIRHKKKSPKMRQPTQNGPKWVPKWTPFFAEFCQKWYQNLMWIPRWPQRTPGDPKMDPQDLTWPKNDSKVIQNDSNIDPKMDPKLSQNGTKLMKKRHYNHS